MWWCGNRSLVVMACPSPFHIRLFDLLSLTFLINMAMYPPHNAHQVIEMYYNADTIFRQSMRHFEFSEGFTEVDVRVMVSFE